MRPLPTPAHPQPPAPRAGLIALALLLACASLPTATRAAAPLDTDRPPNVILIFCDDLGYADIGPFGADRIRTPHLDRLAREGIRFTDFYVAQAVCSASRAALLTGCYPNRIGISGALDHRSTIGLHPDETTLAELLRDRGYATAIFGKWHLGHHLPFLPTRHGFQEWLGIPYSNDMWPFHPEAPPGTYPPLPLFENDRILHPDVQPHDQDNHTTLYTQRALDFIARHRDRPFFLYLAHPMPHVPLHVHDRRRGRSRAGLYGDVVEELDWSLGQILRALRRHRLDRHTLVLFTSDNGPWLSYGDHAGSAKPLREGKGTAWEGGVRVPFLARWPGRIPPGAVCREPAMTIDLLPTLARLAGAPLPDRPIDGRDITPLLTGQPGARSPHRALWFYYHANELHAVRAGPWKLVFPHRYRTLADTPPATGGIPARYLQTTTPLALYRLDTDPGETTDLASTHPDVVARLQALAEEARADLGDSLTQRPPTRARPPGRWIPHSP
ncbi:MAG: sulfatase [Verrucomicrobiae bacterium]|nr:sulfatase [Verrucomicrobiae bacterium]